jgi:hypothetical protein
VLLVQKKEAAHASLPGGHLLFWESAGAGVAEEIVAG